MFLWRMRKLILELEAFSFVNINLTYIKALVLLEIERNVDQFLVLENGLRFGV